jgi:cation transport ATPase
LAVAGIAGILTALRLGQWGEILISALSIFMALRLLIEIVRDLRKGNYGVDILAAVAIVATIAVGEYWATIIIVIMMTSGQALEEYAARRAKAELTSLLERAPKITYLKVGDSTRDIPIGEVAINDMLIIKPGEIIPVDAIISEGSSSIDQSSLTGESLPVDKTVGDELMSGSVNGSSALAIKALRTAGDSQYAQIVELVKAAGAVYYHLVCDCWFRVVVVW